jgi:hypothetical protein
MIKYGGEIIPEISIISSWCNIIALSAILAPVSLPSLVEAILDKTWLCLYVPPLGMRNKAA